MRIFFTIAAALLLSSTVNGADKSGDTNVTINLSTKGNDIAFDQTAIQVKLGNSIKLKFVNQAAKGSEILHNVAVLAPGSVDPFIKDLQASGYDLDKIKGNKAILSMTKAIEPGQEVSLEFHPKEAGIYPYLCLMAGHGDMLGMKGLINVTK